MPGGRGNIVEISVGLNVDEKDYEANIMMALEQREYVIVGNQQDLAVATKNSKKPKVLSDVWCYALQNGLVDWDY
ncbi:MAG: hypothetical protein GY928_39595 [Colwellia sp.]|nr:hypothetical protein [Colwellia sp.]